MTWVLLLLSIPAMADPPYQLRGTNTNQAIGGLNGNFIDQNTLAHDQLTKTITPESCPAGQSLSGAFFNNGYTFGGTCAAVATLAGASSSGVNTFTGSNVFNSSITINGGVFGREISNSTTTLVTGVTGITAGSMGVCYATVTFSTGGKRIEAFFSGHVGGNGDNQLFGFLLDGRFPSGFNSTKGVLITYSAAGTADNASFQYELLASESTAASHSLCLTMATSGTSSLCSTFSGFTTQCQFGAREVP